MRLNSALTLFVIQILAYWPVWIWYAKRVTGSVDEMWGALAWLAIAVLCYRQRSHYQREPTLTLPMLFTLLYALTFSILPPLLQAALAITAIAFMLSLVFFNTRCQIGLVLLALLSLPVIPSLQFYLGYPMRWLIGQAAVPLLSLGGLVVVAEGTSLQWNESLIWIDAPCSGVNMLWSELFLTSILICVYEMRFAYALVAIGGAFVAVMAGNLFRTLGLFYIESGLVDLPEWMHTGVGVLSFAMISVGITAFVFHLSKDSLCRAPSSQF